MPDKMSFDDHVFSRRPIAELYAWFAGEVADTSPIWRQLCDWIAVTPALTERLDELPGQARQPNRFLATIRFLDGPTEPGPGFLSWVEQNWPRIEAIVRGRTTQTNEPGRCAVLAPVLASLPQPVALLELGASGGLCLLPDRYQYRYTGASDLASAPAAAGPQAPEMACASSGPLPADPRGLVVADRLGVDLNPLDVSDADVQRWLRALIWPGETDREDRLTAALSIAAEHPLELRAADLTDDPEALIGSLVRELRARAPGATPVVMHSVALGYLRRADRNAVVAAIRHSGAHWLSFEAPTVIDDVRDRLAELGPDVGDPHLVVALDGVPRARCQAHGRWARWGRS